MDSILSRFLADNSDKEDKYIEQLLLFKTKELQEDFLTLSDGQEPKVVLAAMLCFIATFVFSQPTKELRQEILDILHACLEGISKDVHIENISKMDDEHDDKK